MAIDQGHSSQQEIASDARAVIDGIPGLVTTLTPEGAVEAANPQILDYCGLSLEDLKNWDTNGIVPPEDVELIAPTFIQSIKSGEPYNYECRIRRFDGVYRWFQVRGLPFREGGHIVRWYVLLTDINDQKRFEAALAKREADLRMIVDTIPAGAALMTADGEVEVINKQLRDYFGKTFEELRHWEITDAVHPEDHPRVSEAVRHSLSTGIPYDSIERHRRFDGIYRWFRVQGFPIRDEDGAIVRWNILHTDIDDQRRAEEALDKARSELAHASRTMSLGVLTASIAHEVNQPLSGIVTNASTCLRMLNAETANLEGARAAVQRTLRDAQRASEVIKHLRSMFAHKQSVHEPVYLNEAADEVISLLSSEIQSSRVNMTKNFDLHQPLVRGDRIQLQQVIMNLIVNAIDAMREVNDRPRDLSIATLLTDDITRFSVRDSGVGIDPDNISKLFETFYTTKSNGMGVGLSVSRSIIESHEGRLSASANDGPGATFFFTMPCTSGLAGPPDREFSRTS